MMFVFRAARDLDLYVVWSTNTDGPVQWGPRQEVAEWHLGEYGRAGRTDEVMARVDETGTSLLTGPRPLPGSWDDDRLMVRSPPGGWLPRSRVAEFLDVLEHDEAAAAAMLVPFADEED